MGSESYAKKSWVQVIISLFVFTLGLFVFVQSAKADNTTYYIDSQNGSDANSGKQTDTPWQSLKKVNEQTFKPGDQILLKRGDTWQGQLAPQGNGSSTNPIKLSSYGTGHAPILNGDGTHNYRRNSGTVMLVNQHDWTVSNLEITNYSNSIRSQRSGILVVNTGKEIQSDINIQNNYVHDVNSATQVNGAWKVTGGIILIGINENLDGTRNTNTKMGFSNVTVANNQVENVATAGIRNKTTQLIGNTEVYPKLNTKIVYKNNSVKNVFGDGLIISETKQGQVTNNYISKFANTNTNYNYAGLWVMASDDVTVERNEVANGEYGLNDGTAFDIDLYCNNVTFQYNYSHDNARGTVLFMNASKNGVYRYNVSVNDGYNQDKLISYLPTTTGEAAAIYNNLWVTSPTTRYLLKTPKAQTALHFYNNLLLSQNSKLQTINQSNPTGNLTINNNAIWGYHDQQNFGSNDNQNLTDDSRLQQLVHTLTTNQAGISGLDFSALKDYSAISQKGQVIPTGLLDFDGQATNASAPTIGPIEAK